MNEKICRLCLQTIKENYQTVGESLKNTLKLNLNASKEAVMCIVCTNNLEVLSKFKLACDYIGEQPLPTDLKNFNLNSEKIETTYDSIMESKNKTRCCFCTKTSTREDLTSLSESKEHAFLVDILKEHIPKLNLNIAEELLTCEICLNGLQSVLSFLMKCLDVEQKISTYTEINGTNHEGQVELRDVQQFIFSDVNALGKSFDQFYKEHNVQTKAEIKSEEEMDYPELFIKAEDIDVKSEHSECDSIQGPSAINKIDDESLDNSVLASQEHEQCVNQQERNCAGVTMYTCEICPYQTKWKGCLREHQLVHKSTSEVTLLKCEMCTFETKHRGSLKAHRLLHKNPSDITMFKCKLCPYETKRQRQLKQHELIHESSSNLKMFKCDLCPYKAKFSLYLKRHKLTHKSNSEVTTFKCDVCQYETKYKDYLHRHQVTHKCTSELTMYKCDLCPYEAKYKRYLKRHKLSHSSNPKFTLFKCDLCPYEASHKGYLKRHQLTHANTMFKCDVCPHETKHKYSLKGHMLLHQSSSDVTMFKCELCTYETRRKQYLQRHKLIHKNPADISV